MRRDDVGQPGFDVICCSLEAWDEVWRRNQFFVDALLKREPALRLLFVEPVSDIPWALLHKNRLPHFGLREVGDSRRLWALTLRKWLPRRVWPGIDRSLGRQVARTAEQLGFRRPVLWINDNSYAPLAATLEWPSLYDVTDDWLLASQSERRLERERANDNLMMTVASEIVVCSPSLEASRGKYRPVHLVPNGVDVEHFRHPQVRPPDLPAGRVVLYTGSVSGERVDVGLCARLARRLGGQATLIFVGPDCCTRDERDELQSSGALLLGARPYASMPGYLQHADVIVVPHVVTPFTESLDPIKAREVVAVGRPTVSTPVAGFRELGSPVAVVESERFVDAVMAALDAPPVAPGPGPMPERPGTWDQRAQEFLEILRAARDAGGDA